MSARGEPRPDASRGVTFRRVFKLPTSARTVEREVDDEMRFHLEQRAAELRARGASAQDAREQAAREFGDVDAAREELAAIDRRRLGRERRWRAWDALRQDVRYAARGLARQRGFTAVVLLTLALGIGANATMFGIVDRLLIRPPAHVRDPGRVGRVYVTRAIPGLGATTIDAFSYPDYSYLREHARAFEQLAVAFTTRGAFGRGGETQQIRHTVTSATFWPLLGVRPALGRFFTEAEDRVPVGTAVAVLGHGFWRRQFGGDPAVLGREIVLDRRPYTVIGVAPRGFSGAELDAVDLWTPVSAAGSFGDDWYKSADMIWVSILGRVRPGADPAGLDAELTTLLRRAAAGRERADPAARFAFGPVLRARGPSTVGPDVAEQGRSVKVSAWLAGVAMVVLLVACANVANLLLVRALRRRREIAVRIALGVGRRRLVAQLLTEGMLLAAAGGALGLALAYWGGGVIRALLLPTVAWEGGPVDGRVLAFTTLAVVGTGVLTALAPAAHALREDLTAALKSTGGGLINHGPAGRSGLRNSLLLAQAALSVVLLIGAGLFVRSLQRVRTMDLGFDAERVLNVDVDLGSAGYDTPAARDAFYSAALERVRRLPGVAHAAVGSGVPFWSSMNGRVRVPGRDTLPRVKDGGPYIHAVTADYFATMGTTIVRGRGLTDADAAPGSPRVTVISETMARLYWPGESAVGKCLIIGADTNPCSEVVGVAEDARRMALAREPVMQFYVPLDLARGRPGFRALFVRAAGDPRPLLPAVRDAVQSLAPDRLSADVHLLQTLVDPQVQPWRLGATLFTVFGLLALVLAAVGLYGTLAYAVAQRTHEVGVRLALGAARGDVARLVVWDGVRVVAAGLLLGALAALAAGRAVAPLLFEQSPRDPLVFAGVALTLLATAVLAAALPARRATRVDPATALRAD